MLLGFWVKNLLDFSPNPFLGFHADIEILPIGGLPRSPGKAVRVVDERRF
ncbi:MAG: hypothetical protein J7M03_00145 [Candidatus Desulfofervidaceae bacterium]|nr:hypothetical protein [Candidatus Desulfofervidaceae bacterium]